VNDCVFRDRRPNAKRVRINIVQILIDATGDCIAITLIMSLPLRPSAIQLAMKEEKDGI
jgi:hypothetical protein